MKYPASIGKFCPTVLAGVASFCTYMCFFAGGQEESAFLQSLMGTIFFVVYLAFTRTSFFNVRIRFLLPVSLLVGGVWATGKLLFSKEPLTGSSLSAPVLLLIELIGFTALVWCMGKLLYGLLETAPGRIKKRSLLDFFDKKPMLTILILMLLLWLPHLLLKYPSGMNVDSLDAIDYSLGLQDKNYNPIMYTVIMGAFFKIGLWFGIPNLGIFAFNVVLWLLLAFAVAKGYVFLTKIGGADWSKIFYILFFAFSPFVTGYVGNCIKDMPYISFMLLFLVQLGCWLMEPAHFWHNKKMLVLTGLAGYGMAIFRNNGLYILLIMLALMLAVELHRARGQGSGIYKRALCLLLVGLLPILTNVVAQKLMGSENASSRRESFSLPFQQTARLVLEHPELISEEERAIIDRVLPYDKLAQEYNPVISDPVKNSYREECTAQDRIEYMKLWFKQFFKAPWTYIKAVLAQNYFLFYPESSNYYYYYSCTHYDFAFPDQIVWHIGSPEYISDILGWYYQNFFERLHELPILYFLNNMSTYNIVLLILLCFALTKRDKKMLLIMLPALVTLLGVPLGPCIWSHPRYVFPVIYSLPLLFGLYARDRSNEN